MAASIQQIRQAAEGWSIEVTPAGATKIDSFAACLAPEQRSMLLFCRGLTRWKRWRSQSGFTMRV